MNTSPPYDLVIGLDRSDRKANLHLIVTRTGEHRDAVIGTTPEALWEWLLELRQQHPQSRVALCLEQPAVHLIAFLESYEWMLQHVESEAHRLGARRLVLSVNKRNAKAIAAFQRNGFVIADSVVTNIGHGFVMDDFILVRDLAI